MQTWPVGTTLHAAAVPKPRSPSDRPQCGSVLTLHSSTSKSIQATIIPSTVTCGEAAYAQGHALAERKPERLPDAGSLLMAVQHSRVRRTHFLYGAAALVLLVFVSLAATTGRSGPAALRSAAPSTAQSGQALPQQPASNAQQEHSSPASAVPTRQCGEDPVIYPEWPAGFTPNVSAVFIIGAAARSTSCAGQCCQRSGVTVA